MTTRYIDRAVILRELNEREAYRRRNARLYANAIYPKDPPVTGELQQAWRDE